MGTSQYWDKDCNHRVFLLLSAPDCHGNELDLIHREPLKPKVEVLLDVLRGFPVATPSTDGVATSVPSRNRMQTQTGRAPDYFERFFSSL
jgi:hypothetical protein